MKCLETRRKNGMRWRRYRTDDGRAVRTYEIPEAVVSHIGLPRVEALVAKFERGEPMRRNTHWRRTRARELRARGWKLESIALEVGVSLARVRQYLED